MSADTIPSSPFTEYSIESAPPAARRFMTATRDHLGYLPAGMARMAASPQLIDGFLKLTAIFESAALEPLAREVVVMTVATRNRCHICVAMHTARLTALGADPGLIEALRNPELGDPDRTESLPDERLDAVRVFALRVLDTAGDVGEMALRDFLAAGYTTQNALEVVLGIGTYTMSTMANRLTGAPVDDQLAAYAWALSCSMTQNDEEARVILRPLGPDDQDEYTAQARASMHLHHRWYSTPTTPEEFGSYLVRLSQPATEGFLVCLRDGGAMAGLITIDSIIRGTLPVRQRELRGVRGHGRAWLHVRGPGPGAAARVLRAAAAPARGEHPAGRPRSAWSAGWGSARRATLPRCCSSTAPGGIR